MVDRFYSNRALAGKEIRFTAASNAFSSLAYVVAGNGCRPPFSEIPYLPMFPCFERRPPAYALKASFRGAKLELFTKLNYQYWKTVQKKSLEETRILGARY